MDLKHSQMKKILFTLAAAVAICFTACAQQTEKKQMNAPKTLIAYFSATGTTAEAAKGIAEATGGTLHAITPAETYTAADLDWNDKQSRSSKEMQDPRSRPAIKGTVKEMDGYDVVFIGYPIWWNQAPRIINTFIESHKLEGKAVVPFATSGGSGIKNSIDMLKKAYPNLDWREGKLLNHADAKDIKAWTGSIRP